MTDDQVRAIQAHAMPENDPYGPVDWDPPVLNIDWFDDQHGAGMHAICAQWPAWRFHSEKRDDDAAAESLMAHRSKHTRILFTAPMHTIA